LGIRGGLEGLDFDEYGCFSECFHFHCLWGHCCPMLCLGLWWRWDGALQMPPKFG
jgi:hypothetical protein